MRSALHLSTNLGHTTVTASIFLEAAAQGLAIYGAPVEAEANVARFQAAWPQLVGLRGPRSAFHLKVPTSQSSIYQRTTCQATILSAYSSFSQGSLAAATLAACRYIVFGISPILGAEQGLESDALTDEISYAGALENLSATNCNARDLRRPSGFRSSHGRRFLRRVIHEPLGRGHDGNGRSCRLFDDHA